MKSEPIDYVEAVMAVKSLSESKGWEIYVAEFEARFIALTNTALDVTTDSVTAEHLRQARGRIEQEFDPVLIVSQLLTKTRTRADAQLRAHGSGLDSKQT